MISPKYFANLELIKIPGTKLTDIGFKINNMTPVVVKGPEFEKERPLTEMEEYGLRFIAIDILQQLERKIMDRNTIVFDNLNSDIQIHNNRRYIKRCYNDYCISDIYITPTNNIIASIYRWDENNEVGMRIAGIDHIAEVLIG